MYVSMKRKSTVMWIKTKRRKSKIKIVLYRMTLLALIIAMVEEIRSIIELRKCMLWRNKMAERMAARRLHLYNECTKSGLDGSEYNASTWEFLFNQQYHIIWCNIFKAASTSWMFNFNFMANYTAEFLARTKVIPVQLARYKYPRLTMEEIEKAQSDSITFMIARHPFVRLASAYKDKIVRAIRRTYYYKIRLDIIMKYRKKSTIQQRRGTRIRRQKHAGSSQFQNSIGDEKPIPTEKYPMFEEFVSYVLDEAQANHTLNMHWVPYTFFCTPCKINFDLILKLETIEDDQKYLIDRAHLEGIINPEWRNRGETNESYVISLFSRISRHQLHGLYQLYKYDFQLFNYSIDRYYHLIEGIEKAKEHTLPTVSLYSDDNHSKRTRNI